MSASNNDPIANTMDQQIPEKDTRQVVTPEHVRRIENMLDSYDALRAYFPDDEFPDAWEPIIEPLLWATPEERDPELLAHADRLAPTSPLWSTVRRVLDYQDSLDTEQE